MKHFLIVTNTVKDVELKVTNNITEYLMKKGMECTVITDMQEGVIQSEQSLPKNIDIVIVLGGDGTMLRTTYALGDRDVLVVGINLGTLGFLTEVEPQNLYEALERLITGDFEVEERMLILGSVYRDGEEVIHSGALNDIVVSRAGFPRIICLQIKVNNRLLDVYEADGVIIATPTGSTGYNLSAGGPIVSPKADLIIVTPISPHSLSTKSIAFSADDTIEIEVVKKRETQKGEAIVTFDGRSGLHVVEGDVIRVQKSTQTLKLIKLSDTNFYEVLRSKIGY